MSEELLTIAEAQARVGLKGKRGYRLMNLLIRRERERKRQIMVRMPGQRRVHYRITMAALRRWCPELFPESAVVVLRRAVPGLVELIDHRAHAVFDARLRRDILPRLKELWDRDESVAKSVKSISEALGNASQSRPAQTGK